MSMYIHIYIYETHVRNGTDVSTMQDQTITGALLMDDAATTATAADAADGGTSGGGTGGATDALAAAIPARSAPRISATTRNDARVACSHTQQRKRTHTHTHAKSKSRNRESHFCRCLYRTATAAIFSSSVTAAADLPALSYTIRLSVSFCSVRFATTLQNRIITYNN
eukprot:COSAG06_NODE_608_length_13862_cov_86.760355_9_plen_168_part_00